MKRKLYCCPNCRYVVTEIVIICESVSGGNICPRCKQTSTMDFVDANELAKSIRFNRSYHELVNAIESLGVSLMEAYKRMANAMDQLKTIPWSF